MSRSPLEALQMRCDLAQWDQAMNLAEKLAPERVPQIGLQFAQHLETSGAFNYEVLLFDLNFRKIARCFGNVSQSNGVRQ